jgi:hypothetical protein
MSTCFSDWVQVSTDVLISKKAGEGAIARTVCRRKRSVETKDGQDRYRSKKKGTQRWASDKLRQAWRRAAPSIAMLSLSMTKLSDETKRVTRTEPARRPEDWSASEKLSAVMESSALGETELGVFLGARGLARNAPQAMATSCP